MLHIRPATAHDLPSLAHIDQYNNPHPWQIAQFSGSLQSPHTHIWLGETQGEICTFIVWQTLFNETELHLIATAPNHRQQGFASQLINTMLAANPNNRFFLEVRQSNLAAQKLYAKHGFHIIAQRNNYYGNEHAIIMEKSC
ncbi:ribosomal-protein-alanine N-acetyltransferase [Alysiella filiformis DSM 16848]|uniref:[Ribosomal protein bS18]-alanine N-acetyltransferase n=1 Tax=Alysiella filiformis DSM 16848 TaxID=1120981 RepID=A0A286E6W5_9NEIS|nr:ribosomal-protein-alanine N-acetyltransferase [Alysiella filiformis DSM 16848]